MLKVSWGAASFVHIFSPFRVSPQRSIEYPLGGEDSQGENPLARWHSFLILYTHIVWD